MALKFWMSARLWHKQRIKQYNWIAQRKSETWAMVESWLFALGEVKNINN